MAEAPAPLETPDKWLILRELTAARASFSVSDRDLAVLAALLSFHPAKELADDARLIVFPSNIALSGRVHGMPESTLRRHLARLVQAGLILRHDSPNGKRYALRGVAGRVASAFGFDLRPLLVRWPEIRDAAQSAREAESRKQILRQTITLRLRDAVKLVQHATETGLTPTDTLEGHLAELQRMLRRKLDLPQLSDLAERIERLLSEITRILPTFTENPSGNDSQNERHIQNSETYIQESESAQRKEEEPLPRDIPLEIVLKATPEISVYTADPIRNWRDFWQVANHVRPMLGIDDQTWTETRHRMDDQSAAISIACMLQRIGSIRSPGAYLRALGKKAAEAKFSARAMIMALLRSPATLSAAS